jgi:hypothetical protein
MVIGGNDDTSVITPENNSSSPPKPPTMSQHVDMFSLKKMKKLSEGTKTLLYIMWKEHSGSLGTIEKSTIDEELSKLNALEFDWTKLPKHNYQEVFEEFSYEQICYICGCKRLQFDLKLMQPSVLTVRRVKTKLIAQLWDHMMIAKDIKIL